MMVISFTPILAASSIKHLNTGDLSRTPLTNAPGKIESIDKVHVCRVWKENTVKLGLWPSPSVLIVSEITARGLVFVRGETFRSRGKRWCWLSAATISSQQPGLIKSDSDGFGYYVIHLVKIGHNFFCWKVHDIDMGEFANPLIKRPFPFLNLVIYFVKVFGFLG